MTRTPCVLLCLYSIVCVHRRSDGVSQSTLNLSFIFSDRESSLTVCGDFSYLNLLVSASVGCVCDVALFRIACGACFWCVLDLCGLDVVDCLWVSFSALFLSAAS